MSFLCTLLFFTVKYLQFPAQITVTLKSSAFPSHLEAAVSFVLSTSHFHPSGTLFSAHSFVQKDDPSPYLAYLKSHFNPCVGVLIKSNWVLAPAHCYLP